MISKQQKIENMKGNAAILQRYITVFPKDFAPSPEGLTVYIENLQEVDPKYLKEAMRRIFINEDCYPSYKHIMEVLRDVVLEEKCEYNFFSEEMAWNKVLSCVRYDKNHTGCIITDKALHDFGIGRIATADNSSLRYIKKEFCDFYKQYVNEFKKGIYQQIVFGEEPNEEWNIEKLKTKFAECKKRKPFTEPFRRIRTCLKKN